MRAGRATEGLEEGVRVLGEGCCRNIGGRGENGEGREGKRKALEGGGLALGEGMSSQSWRATVRTTVRAGGNSKERGA